MTNAAAGALGATGVVSSVTTSIAGWAGWMPWQAAAVIVVATLVMQAIAAVVPPIVAVLPDLANSKAVEDWGRRRERKTNREHKERVRPAATELVNRPRRRWPLLPVRK